MKSSLFKKHIAVPQDHGSWVFILSPLLIGIFASKHFNYGSFNLIVASMAAFMLRQPMTVLVKILAARRPDNELPIARFWLAVYSGIALLSVIALILEGFYFIL